MTEFSDIRDMNRVKEGIPWLFDRNLIILKEFDGITPPATKHEFQNETRENKWRRIFVFMETKNPTTPSQFFEGEDRFCSRLYWVKRGRRCGAIMEGRRRGGNP